MRPPAIPDRTGSAIHGSHIGSPRDVIRCLHQVTPVLMPGDSLVLFLDREQHVTTHLRVGYDPLCPIGPPIHMIFREAFTQHASQLLMVAMHPSCRTGPLVPAADVIQYAVRCSLAGQLLDLRLIDYLICNDTDSQSLLIDYRDELYRSALHYSHQQANGLLHPHEICPN